MKIAVERQSGPFWMVETTCPIQLSPAFIEASLCCETWGLGMTTLKLGSVPASASSTTSCRST
jgi:hypothetical protein